MGSEQGLAPPLVDSDVDLRDFGGVMIHPVRLFGSEFHARATDAEWRAGMTLWLKSFHQSPAGSLPTDDVALARLAEFGRDLSSWAVVKEMALWKWRLCSDGRLYHPVVADVVNEAWAKKVAQRERTRKAREARMAKEASDGGLSQDDEPAATTSATGPVTTSVTEPDEPCNSDSDNPSHIDCNNVLGKGREGKRRDISSLRSEPPQTGLPLDTGSTSSPKSSRQVQGTRLPGDWTLPDDWRLYARSKHPRVDLDREAERFRDYWHAKAGKDGRKADWPATWRNWLRKAEDLLPQQAPALPAGRNGKSDPSIEQWTLVLEHWIRDGSWYGDGVEPSDTSVGTLSCKVPKHLIPEAMARRKAVIEAERPQREAERLARLKGSR